MSLVRVDHVFTDNKKKKLTLNTDRTTFTGGTSSSVTAGLAVLDKTALFNTKPLGKQSKEEYGREDKNVSQVAKRNMVRHLSRSLHVQDFMAFEKSIYIRVSLRI